MISEKMYKYIGRNGTITSPVYLQNIEPIKMRRLTASSGKSLTDGYRTLKTVVVFEDEVEDWAEIDDE